MSAVEEGGNAAPMTLSVLLIVGAMSDRRRKEQADSRCRSPESSDVFFTHRLIHAVRVIGGGSWGWGLCHSGCDSAPSLVNRERCIFRVLKFVPSIPIWGKPGVKKTGPQAGFTF